MNLRRELINGIWSLWPRSVATVVDGRRFRVPLQRGFDRRLLNASREPWLDQAILQACAGSGAVLVDVGANCGQTLLKARALQPDLRYVGFEPNPACAGYVQQLIALNRLPDSQVFACALGAEVGATRLFVASPADPSATVIANFRGRETGATSLSVLVETGDEMLARLALDRVDLLKIDVEGAEAEVLAGLEATIRRYRPVIACEVLRSHDPAHPTHDLRQRSKARINQQVAALGYSIFGLEGEVQQSVSGVSDRYRNYLFRPAATMRSTSAVVE